MRRELDLIVLEYLRRRGYIHAMRCLEEESGLQVESLGQDASFLRSLVLDGRWGEVDTLLEPLERANPVAHAAAYRYLLRQRLLERLETGGGDEDGGLEALVQILRALEDISAPDEFRKVCKCLTLSHVKEDPDLKDWTVYRGRMGCFEAVQRLLSPLLNEEERAGDEKWDEHRKSLVPPGQLESIASRALEWAEETQGVAGHSLLLSSIYRTDGPCSPDMTLGFLGAVNFSPKSPQTGAGQDDIHQSYMGWESSSGPITKESKRILYSSIAASVDHRSDEGEGKGEPLDEGEQKTACSPPRDSHVVDSPVVEPSQSPSAAVAWEINLEPAKRQPFMGKSKGDQKMIATYDTDEEGDDESKNASHMVLSPIKHRTPRKSTVNTTSLQSTRVKGGGYAAFRSHHVTALSPVTLLEESHPIRIASFDRTGSRFAVGCNNRTLRICEAPDDSDLVCNTGGAVDAVTLVERPAHHKGSIYCLSWDSSSSLIATGSNDKTIRIIGMGSQGEEHVPHDFIIRGMGGTVRDVEFSPQSCSSLLLAVGTGNCLCGIWDAVNPHEPVLTFEGGGGDTHCGRWLEPDKLAVTGNDVGQLNIWDCRSRELAFSVDAAGSNGSIEAVKIRTGGPDDQVWAAVGMKNGSVALVDLRQRTILQTLDEHADECRCVDFSPDGQWLVTGGFDSVIATHRVVTQQSILQPISKLKGHGGRILSLNWHPFRPEILSTSTDCSVTLWSLS
jgi:WD40 repeat protein